MGEPVGDWKGGSRASRARRTEPAREARRHGRGGEELLVDLVDLRGAHLAWQPVPDRDEHDHDEPEGRDEPVPQRHAVIGSSRYPMPRTVWMRRCPSPSSFLRSDETNVSTTVGSPSKS